MYHDYSVKPDFKGVDEIKTDDGAIYCDTAEELKKCNGVLNTSTKLANLIVNWLDEPTNTSDIWLGFILHPNNARPQIFTYPYNEYVSILVRESEQFPKLSVYELFDLLKLGRIYLSDTFVDQVSRAIRERCDEIENWTKEIFETVLTVNSLNPCANYLRKCVDLIDVSKLSVVSVYYV